MKKTRIRRAAVEAAGWLCLLGVLIVVNGMECAAIRLAPGAALSYGLALAGGLLLWKAGIVRIPRKAGRRADRW